MISSETLKFKVKPFEESDWFDVAIPLNHLRKSNFTCDESLSMDIKEYIYATDSSLDDEEIEFIFDVNDYWDDIVISTHKLLYPEKYL